ncbi:MAG: hypothetical protein WCF16_11895 [Alphaproteobacteria bacterium]
MSIATTTKPASIAAFPAAEVEACLRVELLHAVESAAALKGEQMPSGLEAQLTMPTQIDSLVVVELLFAVEPIVDFALKDTVVRAGGYRSIIEAVGHLIPRIEKEWQKHKSKGGKK